MGKQFNSVEALVSYIKSSCHPDALDKIGRESVEIMKEVTESQYEGDTGQMVDCVGVTSTTNDSVEMKWQDNGDWFSLVKDTYGDHMYAPIAHEMGKVWGKGHNRFNPVYKPATTLEETSTEKIEEEAPDIYKQVMRSKGFDVR